MEKPKTNFLKPNQSSRHFSADRNLSFTTTRKKLIDQALDKEKPQVRPSSASRHRSHPQPKKFEKNSTMNLKSLNDTLPKKTVTKLNLKALNETKKPISRSRSPACVKRTSSVELSKTRAVRGKSVERIKQPTKILTKLDLFAEEVSKIVNQFSIQRINDLKNFSLIGNVELGKAFTVLFKDVDCLKDPRSGLHEIFLDYLRSPGITVKTLKKLPMYLLTGKIPESKFYLENFTAAFEIYNKIESILNSLGHLLLSSLFDTIFKYKNFPVKCVHFLHPSEIDLYKPEKLNKTVVVKKVPEIKTHSKTESLNILKTTIKAESSFEESDEKVCSEKIEESFETNFKESKKILLNRFFDKMINPIKFEEIVQTKTPLGEVKNLNLEPVMNDNGTKGKNSYRPSSTTPRPETKFDFSHIDGILGKAKEIKAKHEEQKRKNLMIGSRFYKKIDEKFIKILVEKMKKDSKTLLKLKLKSTEEYSQKKGEYIELNKEQWVKETLSLIRESETQENENEMLHEIKHSALADYLSQEKTIQSLVAKAEQLESSYRKL